MVIHLKFYLFVLESQRIVSVVIKNTFQMLIEACGKLYLKPPETNSDWIRIQNHFESRWDFPFCTGAIDGKHIAIYKPSNSGSEYINYKGKYKVHIC